VCLVCPVVAVDDLMEGACGVRLVVEQRVEEADRLGQGLVDQRDQAGVERRDGARSTNDRRPAVDQHLVACLRIGVAGYVRHAAPGLAARVCRWRDARLGLSNTVTSTRSLGSAGATARAPGSGARSLPGIGTSFLSLMICPPLSILHTTLFRRFPNTTVVILVSCASVSFGDNGGIQNGCGTACDSGS
jgi:hypothetical protein